MENNDSTAFKVGDVEKEREIERRLRDLGLWENKRRLESHVASMLEAQIDEKDALSRTLKNCRRKRSDGKSAIDEIRNIISPRVIRDCYGQKLAYHVNILMGCFTRDVSHDLIDDVIVICGSTGAQDDPNRLTKEIRLELPASLNMAALMVSYAAGAVKIRVPYLLEDLPKSRSSSNASEGNGGNQYKFSSISPLYSLQKQLGNRRQPPGSSDGADSLSTGSDPLDVAAASSAEVTSNSSPGSVNSETRSLSDELQLSPYPVFEELDQTQHNDVPEKSDRELFSLESKTAATDRRFTVDDNEKISVRSERLSPFPSSEHKFNRPNHADNIVISNGTEEFSGKLASKKSSECRSQLDLIRNGCSNGVLNDTIIKDSQLDVVGSINENGLNIGLSSERRFLPPSYDESVDLPDLPEKVLTTPLGISTNALRTDVLGSGYRRNEIDESKVTSVHLKDELNNFSIRNTEHQRPNELSDFDAIYDKKLHSNDEWLISGQKSGQTDLAACPRQNGSSKVAAESLNDDRPKSTGSEVSVAEKIETARPVGNRMRTKRPRANLNSILDALNETFL